MTVSAVLFDCDGVVVDSEGATFDLLAEDIKAYGIHLSHAEMERLFLGGTMYGVGMALRHTSPAVPEDWADRFYAETLRPSRQGHAADPRHRGRAGCAGRGGAALCHRLERHGRRRCR